MLILGGLTNTTVSSGDGVLRKIAHATEFAVLGAELTILMRVIKKKPISLLLLSGLSAALIDETIQLFTNGRAGLVKDIWIDLGGVVAGLTLVLLIRWVKYKKCIMK